MNSAHKNALYEKMFTFKFHALSDIQKQTLFNHIHTYMQLQPIFPRMSFKTMKLESKHLTVVPLSDIVYFFVLRSYISKVLILDASFLGYTND